MKFAGAVLLVVGGCACGYNKWHLWHLCMKLKYLCPCYYSLPVCKVGEVVCCATGSDVAVPVHVYFVVWCDEDI